MNRDPNQFTDAFRVQDSECDAENRMTPGAILRRAQQIATDHVEHIGQTVHLRKELHCAYLLAKTAMEIPAPIPAGRQIFITTRPSAPQRAVYHRCTTFSDESGAVLCSVDSRWVLVDLCTRRILRHPPEGFPMPFTQPPAFLLPLDFPRGELIPIAEETASYTRCDINRHLNNTFYADIILDHVPLERLTTAAPARLVLLYHNEIPMGTSFTLSRASTGPNSWYFCGQEPNAKKYFEAYLALTDN